jgi:hypothetical protein
MKGEIIYNLSNEEYHDRNGKYGDYISSSLLKLYAKSPAAYKYALDHPQEQTDAMRFGSLFHDLMASLAKYGDFDNAYRYWRDGLAIFTPPANERTGQPYGATTKAYKEAYDRFTEDCYGKTIVTMDELELAFAMAGSIYDNCGSTSEQVRKLLKWGTPEVSIFYETEEGIKIKIRPDLLTSGKIVDWKTVNTDDLSEESLNRIILRYGYHISAAQYQWVAKQVLGKWLNFYEVFVSKVPPYDAVMVNMSSILVDNYGVEHYGYGYCYDSDEDIVHPGCGALEFKRLRDLHTKCTKENHWPGAETFIPGDKYRIMEIEPPRWYNNKFIDEI